MKKFVPKTATQPHANRSNSPRETSIGTQALLAYPKTNAPAQPHNNRRSSPENLLSSHKLCWAKCPGPNRDPNKVKVLRPSQPRNVAMSDQHFSADARQPKVSPRNASIVAQASLCHERRSKNLPHYPGLVFGMYAESPNHHRSVLQVPHDLPPCKSVPLPGELFSRYPTLVNSPSALTIHLSQTFHPTR